MARLSCENEFCIYQKQGSCVLKSVQLDIRGSCLDCIYINIEEDMLNNQKEKILENLRDCEL